MRTGNTSKKSGFQSQQAPQKEPMREQALIPDDNFDIVTDKHAGILVKLNRANMDPNEKFKIVWYNAEANERVYQRQCFHQPLKKHAMELTDLNEECIFTKDSFRKKRLYKLFPILFHFNNKKFENYKINVLLYSDKYANNQKYHKIKTFSVKAFDSGYLNIGLTRIKKSNNNCNYQSSLDLYLI